VETSYPSWVLAIAAAIIFAGIAPIPIVFLLRRFQCVKFDVDIHQGSIRRIDTTVSTKEMMGDVDVSIAYVIITLVSICIYRNVTSCDHWRLCDERKHGGEMSAGRTAWLVVVRGVNVCGIIKMS
jgi:hypothetical protein